MEQDRKRYLAGGGVLVVIAVVAGAVLMGGGPQPISQDPWLNNMEPTLTKIAFYPSNGSEITKRVNYTNPTELQWSDVYSGFWTVDKKYYLQRSNMTKGMEQITYAYPSWTVRGHWKVFPDGAIPKDHEGASLILNILEQNGSAEWFTSEVRQNISIESAGEYTVHFKGMNPAFQVQDAAGCIDVGARLFVRQDGETVKTEEVVVTWDETDTTMPVQLDPGTYTFGVEAYGVDDGCGLPHHEMLLVKYLAIEQ